MLEPLIWAWAALGALMLPVLFFKTAPYGRHAEGVRGPTLPARLGWLIMESPAALVFAGAFFARGTSGPAAWVLFALWELHYVNRAFVYPFRLGGAKPMPLMIVGSAIFFCCVNGFFNGWSSAPRAEVDARLVTGAALFVVGFALNQHADAVLRGLRRPGESGYQIPRGGLYRFVTCPNYFGEIVEWCGFAVAAWTPAALAFALWTIANLAPRALAHHRWYREKFSDYPSERRALVPGLF